MKKQRKSADELDADRKRGFAQASEEWNALTKGDWPEEEHEQRFNALLKKAMFLPPPGKPRGAMPRKKP